MSYDEFRLDGVSLADPDSPQQRLVSFHFNVPSRLAASRVTFEEIRDRVISDFPVNDAPRVVQVPYFQISAVYELIHRVSGAVRLWSGSFNLRSRELGQVTPFRPFDPASFVDFVQERSQPEYIQRQQQNVADQKETAWTVGDVLSAVITIQATVRPSHSIFDRYPQLREHHGARGQAGVGRHRVRRKVVRLLLG